MRILVIGSGAREHVLTWKLAQSEQVEKIYAAPGNGGISNKAERIPIKAGDMEELARFAEEKSIDLTVVGPEQPLSKGIVDLFQSKGLKIFGPTKKAAIIESSKAWAKEFMSKYHIPTAPYRIFDNKDDASDFMAELQLPFVIKADGLAAGKGAIIVHTREEAEETLKDIMVERKFGEAGNRVIIEEKLEGEELSLLALTDGKSVLPLIPSQDHKAIYDDDEGPNTGGMGAYAPVPFVSGRLQESILDLVFEPAIRGLAQEGRPFKGVLYAGLMITDFGPKVIEFNCRFGDPETQVILPLLENDLAELCLAVANQDLQTDELKFKDNYCVGVVMAAGGYPGNYEKGLPIQGLLKAQTEGRLVFHAGTEMKDGQVVTSGGRVLTVCAMADNLQDAIASAYEGVEKISFDNAHFRKDIAARASRRKFKLSRQV
ncbi:MAG TPA: phosphoribosylamine--glycine ligase [candidate division Zixibacteria bacterium]|nr:phosphoribosylamine--glycine ligase [candidate division Zixibacteria bacterium]